MTKQPLKTALLGCALFLMALLLTATTYRAALQQESFIEYEASDSRSTWQGRAPLETLELTFDSDTLNELSLEATLDPGKFDSGNLIRDANARRGVFETGEYPVITLTAEGVQAETASLAVGETETVNLVGTLDMHGVTREVTVPAEVSLTNTGGNRVLRASGNFGVLLSDYDMDRPSFLGTTVADEVTVRFSVVGALSETGTTDSDTSAEDTDAGAD